MKKAIFFAKKRKLWENKDMIHKNKNYINVVYTNEKDEGFFDKTISKLAT